MTMKELGLILFASLVWLANLLLAPWYAMWTLIIYIAFICWVVVKGFDGLRSKSDE